MVKFQDHSSFMFHRDSPFEFSPRAKGLLGCITKKDYDFRVKQDYLRKQEGFTALDLVCPGLPVFGRVTFDRICYHPVFFGKPHVLDHFIQFFSCPAIEWNPCFIFAFPGSFSYKENFRITGPFSYDSSNCAFVERTPGAFNYLPCNSFVSGFHHYSDSLFKISTVILFICRYLLPPLVFFSVIRYILKLLPVFDSDFYIKLVIHFMRPARKQTYLWKKFHDKHNHYLMIKNSLKFTIKLYFLYIKSHSQRCAEV